MLTLRVTRIQIPTPFATVTAWLRTKATALREWIGFHFQASAGRYCCPLCASVYDDGHDCSPVIRLRAYCVDCDTFRLVDRYGECPCGSRSTRVANTIVMERR